ncbi:MULTISPECIES: hypothetical protein [unclassified Imperialibacter]|uniref:hypothetical protein n=1 Tax=unclassified Imperialibacter TaxID=2629706 RepID=UPI00125F7241|nr:MULTISPECIES: hypothetical protein [unclassified Imperialibacter]
MMSKSLPGGWDFFFYGDGRWFPTSWKWRFSLYDSEHYLSFIESVAIAELRVKSFLVFKWMS